jgi:hypothetical protein
VLRFPRVPFPHTLVTAPLCAANGTSVRFPELSPFHACDRNVNYVAKFSLLKLKKKIAFFANSICFRNTDHEGQTYELRELCVCVCFFECVRSVCVCVCLCVSVCGVWCVWCVCLCVCM